MYLLYFPNQISASLICQLEAVGWIMKEVERIPVPWNGNLSDKFVDQFTKLQIWSLTEFNSIIYIDSDAIVLQKIDNLFEIVNSRTKFEFATAPDVLDKQILTKFNAESYPHLWPILFPDIKVIHFTVEKPFLSTLSNEIFDEPFEVWNSLYSEMEK
ncbi:28234_t:CDS:2, partial [Dentiscutata erythropus]